MQNEEDQGRQVFFKSVTCVIFVVRVYGPNLLSGSSFYFHIRLLSQVHYSNSTQVLLQIEWFCAFLLFQTRVTTTSDLPIFLLGQLLLNYYIPKHRTV